MQEQESKSWYDKWYKILFLIPLLITILSITYISYFYLQHNSLIYKDVTLSGGTTITLSGDIDFSLESSLKQKFPDIVTRKLTDLRTGEDIAFVIESSASPEELKPAVEESLGYALTDENSSIEFTGPTLSQSFYQELLKMVFISFILMALVIFFIFGKSRLIKSSALVLSFSAVKLTFQNSLFITILVVTLGISGIIYSLAKLKKKQDYIYIVLSLFVFLLALFYPFYSFIYIIALILFVIYIISSLPSIAVIFAAFSDIVFALVIVNILEIKLSSAGIAAFLMLIGYSVDTDILLTTRALQKEGTLNNRIYRAFKTGILMTFTALVAVVPSFFLITGIPDSFRQIFLILALGLSADIINTWLTNASIIKWYCKKQGIQ